MSTLTSRLADVVARDPHAPAVRDERSRITYATLDIWSGRVAGALRRRGVHQGATVGLDTRPDSPTNGAINEFFLGAQNPQLVQVPNLVYHGWKCISTEASLVINVPTDMYNYGEPDEYRLEPHDTLPYDWTRRDG